MDLPARLEAFLRPLVAQLAEHPLHRSNVVSVYPDSARLLIFYDPAFDGLAEEQRIRLEIAATSRFNARRQAWGLHRFSGGVVLGWEIYLDGPYRALPPAHVFTVARSAFGLDLTRPDSNPA